MTGKNAVLVVGGDSLVGGGMVAALSRRGTPSYATTRRRDTVGAGRVYFDFESFDSFRAPVDVGAACVIAAATNYDRCETDPLAKVINVELIPGAVAALLAQGLFVTFVSTNSVFGGERPWPHEDDPHAPGIAYSRQKSDAEQIIRERAEQIGATDRLNIVRLTKIMNSGVSPVPAWLESWKRNEGVSPFEDLIFAPISVKFVGEALATICEKRVSGNLHISGSENVTYVEFANALAQRLGVDASLIAATTATAKGVNIAFKPRFSGLGMTRTAELTGVRPQPLDRLIDDIVEDLGH
jgi:dTDP-4-dehydrorhamnose reductase